MDESMPARRKAFLASIPWVTWKEKGVRCQEIRSGKTWPTGERDEHRCKAVAHWHFKALRLRGAYDHPAKTGTYCQGHLWEMLERNHQEAARLAAYRTQWKEENAQ